MGEISELSPRSFVKKFFSPIGLLICLQNEPVNIFFFINILINSTKDAWILGHNSNSKKEHIFHVKISKSSTFKFSIKTQTALNCPFLSAKNRRVVGRAQASRRGGHRAKAALKILVVSSNWATKARAEDLLAKSAADDEKLAPREMRGLLALGAAPISWLTFCISQAVSIWPTLPSKCWQRYSGISLISICQASYQPRLQLFWIQLTSEFPRVLNHFYAIVKM